MEVQALKTVMRKKAKRFRFVQSFTFNFSLETFNLSEER